MRPFGLASISEDQITYPIVSALISTPHVKAVRGFTDFGISYVYVIFQDATDMCWAHSRVVEYLQGIRRVTARRWNDCSSARGRWYRFSLLVCGHPEDAEDVMQEALLKTYGHVNRIRKPDAFRTWLYQTVRNACLMKRRRRVDEPSQLVSLEHSVAHEGGARRAVDVEDQARPADQRLIDAWVGARLRCALAALPSAYRVIVVLREIEGLATREVATVTGISKANVKARLHRARVMLRNHLEGV